MGCGMGKATAIALMSGGLDSNLAVRLLHDMGIGIIGVHFTGPFCMCNRGAGGCIHYAKKMADELGIEFSTQPLGEAYLDIVVHPKHGYGSGMNPCLDCRILMFRRAKAMMKERDASFIMTGEVLGQRPMSQLRDKLGIIEREAGLERMILRPLSAQHFQPTIAEEQGVVAREALLGIEGRGRRPQMDLAEKLAIGDYPCPAGGCLLTDKHFAARLREHINYAGTLCLSDIPLLKLGRHFRFPSGAKFVVGREKAENERIEKLAGKKGIILVPETVMGPSGVLLGSDKDDELQLSSEILAAYCSAGDAIRIEVRGPGNTRVFDAVRKERTLYSDMMT